MRGGALRAPPEWRSPVRWLGRDHLPWMHGTSGITLDRNDDWTYNRR